MKLHVDGWEKSFSFMIMFIYLVKDVMFLSILNIMINIYKSINCYHIYIWGVLRVIMNKNDKGKMGVILER